MMKTKTLMLIVLASMPGPALAQTMYKCPNAVGTVTFQQMPCTPTGGGQAVEVRKIPAGSGSGLSETAKDYLAEQSEQRAERNRLAEEEAKRQQALDVERHKARAAYEQAAAQRATARAIWATGRR